MSHLADPSLQCKAALTIRIWSDESMTIEGPLADPAWCLRALEAARDEITSRIRRNKDPLNLATPPGATPLGDCMVKPP